MYVGPKSRTERPRKIKIGTEVAHVTRDSNTVKRSKVNLQGAGRGHIVAASRTACFDKHYVVLMLKRICLESGILFMHIFSNRLFR